MKILLFIFLITITLSTQGQVYKPFPTQHGKWVYELYYDDFHDQLNYSKVYELSNDTTIESITYKKIKVNSIYAGALREEDQRIYFYPDTATKEYNLYDFNLAIGDIFTVFGGTALGENTVTLERIDYITASDGTHKQYHFSNYSRWIEAIGSINLLLQPNLYHGCFSFPCDDELKCMKSDQTFHYPAGEEPCIVTSIQQETTSENISIFPNPSNSSFTIDFKNQLIHEVSVSDVLGTLIYRGTVNQETSYTIPAMRTGTYILSISDINNRIVHKKIVSTP